MRVDNVDGRVLRAKGGPQVVGRSDCEGGEKKKKKKKKNKEEKEDEEEE